MDRFRARGTLANTPVEIAAEPPDTAPIASELMVADAQTRRLHACLNGLDRGNADYIRAAFFEGSTYGELATRASTPLGTVKSRIRRALLKLQDYLQ